MTYDLWPYLEAVEIREQLTLSVLNIRGNSDSQLKIDFIPDVHQIKHVQAFAICSCYKNSRMSLPGYYLSLIHISEPTRPLYISYAVFCLKKRFF